jgi:hypothetical protein
MSNYSLKRLWAKYKLATRKNIITNEKERNIVAFIRQLCSDKNTKVSDTPMGYSLVNEVNHVDCLVTGKYVIFTNSVITSDKQYSDEIIKKINALCSNRVQTELDTSVNNMLTRENSLMKNLISNINKNKNI